MGFFYINAADDFCYFFLSAAYTLIYNIKGVIDTGLPRFILFIFPRLCRLWSFTTTKSTSN